MIAGARVGGPGVPDGVRGSVRRWGTPLQPVRYRRGGAGRRRSM